MGQKKEYIFERSEKKYMVKPKEFQMLMEALKPFMQQDQFGLHTISTIYYDTTDFEMIRYSLEKPIYKEKLRLRSYGIPAENDEVYLELKKKLNHITYKRRVGISLSQARSYLEHKTDYLADKGQIFQEIDWVFRRRNLTAATLISYDRIAFYGREDQQLRITFDANIRWRTEYLDLRNGDYGQRLLQPGVRLMEIKTLGSLPIWLCSMLSKFKIYPQSFSKYGEVYQKYLVDNNKEEIGNVG